MDKRIVEKSRKIDVSVIVPVYNVDKYLRSSIKQSIPDVAAFSSGSCAKIDGTSKNSYYAWLKVTPVREASDEQNQRDFDLSFTDSGG